MRFVPIPVLLLALMTAKADEKTELKALSGTWTTEKLIIEGTEQAIPVTLVIDGATYKVTIGDKNDQGTLSVDPAKTPKTCDIIGTEGVNKGKKYLAIYELKDNTLTICYSLEDGVRPVKLESAKDSKTMLAVYKKK